MLEVRNLSKIYKTGEIEVRALDDITLNIERGEMVAVMGPSGSGKSTLMNILGCLDQPTYGSYRINGREVSKLSQWEQAKLRNRELGFVFQSFNLLPKLNALQNVELPLIYAGMPRQKRLEKAKKALEMVGLANRMHHKPKELSGGQQQRVAIARALVNEPRLVLADEPTGNLDSHSSAEIMDFLTKLHRQGITVVLVTHEADIAAYTERIIRFFDGKIVSDEKNPARKAGGEEAS